MKTALVFGASGLVGGYLVEELIYHPDYHAIKSFGRRKVGFASDKVEEFIIDFENLESIKELASGDELYICLGTTIKKAGTYNIMEQIDWHYPVNIAKIASQMGVKKLAVVSSIGANNLSKNNYLRIKGEMENEMLYLKYDNISIVRPSVLFGERKEFRFGEVLGKVFMKVLGFLLIGSLKKYRGIHGAKVARAMIRTVQEKGQAAIYESDELQELGA